MSNAYINIQSKTENSFQIYLNGNFDRSKFSNYTVRVLNITDGNNEPDFVVENVNNFPVLFQSSITGQRYLVVVTGYSSEQIFTVQKEVGTIIVSTSSIALPKEINVNVSTTNFELSEEKVIISPQNASNQNLDGGDRALFQRRMSLDSGFIGKKKIVLGQPKERTIELDSKGNVFALEAGNVGIQTSTPKIYGNSSAFSVVHSIRGVESVRTDVENNLYVTGPDVPVNINVYAEPSDSDNINIKYENKTPDIASIDENGFLTPIKSGIAKIRAYSEFNAKAEVYITVKIHYSSTIFVMWHREIGEYMSSYEFNLIQGMSNWIWYELYKKDKTFPVLKFPRAFNHSTLEEVNIAIRTMFKNVVQMSQSKIFEGFKPVYEREFSFKLDPNVRSRAPRTEDWQKLLDSINQMFRVIVPESEEQNFGEKQWVIRLSDYI